MKHPFRLDLLLEDDIDDRFVRFSEPHVPQFVW